ncbi:MAG TPA: DMT family transporter [Candidatus Dormibacteraeota bacterium]|nr:DMT family transporter [Candidatus Dormibacteraeota bacterium]
MRRGGPGSAAALPALLLAVTSVSFSAIFIRLADDQAVTIVWIRMAFTVALLLPFLLRDVARRALPQTRHDWLLVGASGLFLAAHFLTWTYALRYTSVASSVLLVTLHPVLVAWLGRRILGEPVSPRLAAGIALALAGTAVTSAGDWRLGARDLFGDMLALSGAVMFTGYLLIGRTVRSRTGTAGYSAPVYSVVALCCVAIAPLTGSAIIPSARTALACLGLAGVCTVLGHTVFNWTLRHLRTALVSVSLLGEPVITSLLAIPILHELPPGQAVAGGVVILIGLGLALTERAPAPAREAVELATPE